MMDRTPEEELMQGEEQAKAYAFADFSKPHNLFIETFLGKFPEICPDFNDVVLDLGCGPCDITRRFAQSYADAGFHAVDGSAVMLEFGQELNEKAGLTSRIKLIETSLPHVNLPQQYYHTIISNSLLHHLADPLSLWETIRKHAKPFAPVFVMDLIRPVDEQTVKFLSSVYAANEPGILKEDFENSLRAAYTIKEVRKQLDEMDLGNLQVEEVSDRHMVIYGVL